MLTLELEAAVLVRTAVDLADAGAAIGEQIEQLIRNGRELTAIRKARYAPPEKPSHRPGEECVLYFIQEGSDGPIKIGCSYSISRRLSTLQCGNPRPLVLLAFIPGAQEIETAMHRRFAPHRIQNEWYRPHADILAFVCAVARRKSC